MIEHVTLLPLKHHDSYSPPLRPSLPSRPASSVNHIDPTMHSPAANALPRLPNELFDRIITFVIADSVHSICVSPGDTTWDMDVLPTLHQVSPLFRAISTEVVRKAFDMPRVKQTVDPGEPDAVDEHSSSVSHSSTQLCLHMSNAKRRVLQALRKAFDMPCAKRTVDPGDDALDEHSLSVPHSSINV